jgi:hypothetical protein
METTTQTKTNPLDELQSWANEQERKTSEPPKANSETPKPENGGLSDNGVISETELLSTGTHTKEGFSGNIESPGVTKQPGTTAASTKKILANSGKFAVTLIHEIAIPSLSILVARQFGYTVRKDGLKITKDEKDLLTEAWNEYLSSINIAIEKPIYQLMLALGFVYGSKVADGSIKFEKIKKNMPNESDKKDEPAKVTKENFAKVFEDAREKLIDETRSKMRKNRQFAIKWLVDNKKFIRLEKDLRDKYNVPAA